MILNRYGQVVWQLVESVKQMNACILTICRLYVFSSTNGISRPHIFHAVAYDADGIIFRALQNERGKKFRS